MPVLVRGVCPGGRALVSKTGEGRGGPGGFEPHTLRFVRWCRLTVWQRPATSPGVTPVEVRLLSPPLRFFGFVAQADESAGLRNLRSEVRVLPDPLFLRDGVTGSLPGSEPGRAGSNPALAARRGCSPTWQRRQVESLFDGSSNLPIPTRRLRARSSTGRATSS